MALDQKYLYPFFGPVAVDLKPLNYLPWGARPKKTVQHNFGLAPFGPKIFGLKTFGAEKFGLNHKVLGSNPKRATGFSVKCCVQLRERSSFLFTPTKHGENKFSGTL